MKPIAYGNGRTGDIIHAKCWPSYVDARRNYDAQGRPMAFGVIGTLYYRHSDIKGHKCAHCGKDFGKTK